MKELASYLNDHLAGATAAVNLIEHLAEKHQGGPLEKFFRDLHRDVAEDREQLHRLTQRLGKENVVKKAAGWIAEKIGRTKVAIDGRKPGELGLVEALEALVLGITGKQLLWRALSASLGSSPLLRGADLEKLEERAIEQLERVEAHRLEAAREAFLRA
jgi:hypothetical protein